MNGGKKSGVRLRGGYGTEWREAGSTGKPGDFPDASGEKCLPSGREGGGTAGFRVERGVFHPEGTGLRVEGGSFHVEGGSFRVEGGRFRVERRCFRVEGGSFRVER